MVPPTTCNNVLASVVVPASMPVTLPTSMDNKCHPTIHAACTNPTILPTKFAPGIALPNGLKPKSVQELVSYGQCTKDDNQIDRANNLFGHNEQHINQYLYYKALHRTRENMRSDLRKKLLELQTLRLKNDALKRKSTGAELRRRRRATATATASAFHSKKYATYKKPSTSASNSSIASTTLSDDAIKGIGGNNNNVGNNVVRSVPVWHEHPAPAPDAADVTATDTTGFTMFSMQDTHYDSPVSQENTQENEEF